MTLKQDQGRQTLYAPVDPKQGYNPAKFERPCMKCVPKEANVKVFCQIRKHVNHLP